MDYEDGFLGTQAFQYDEPIQTQSAELSNTEDNTKTQIGTLYIKDKKYPVYKGMNVIGRDPSCDICLHSNTVSMKHAEIEVNNKCSIFICDTNSSNGTLLNNTLLKRNRSYQILNDNIIKFGEVTSIFKCYENEEENKLQEISTAVSNKSMANTQMNYKIVNETDISSISCSQTVSAAQENNVSDISTKNIIEESTETSVSEVFTKNIKSQKSEYFNNDKNIDTSNEDMFEDICDIDFEFKEVKCGLKDENIFEAVTQKFEKDSQDIEINDLEKEGTNALNKIVQNESIASLNDSDCNMMNTVHSTPISKKSKFLIPETPKLINKSMKSNKSMVNLTESPGNLKSLNDEIISGNSEINEQLNQTSNENDIYEQETQIWIKPSDVTKEIFDAETQCFNSEVTNNSIYDAPTQCLTKVITKTSNCNNSGIKNNNFSKTQYTKEIEKDPEKIDVLKTESAEENLSIFDVPTQKIDTTSYKKSDLHVNVSGNNIKNICGDIYVAETQEFNENKKSKHENKSSSNISYNKINRKETCTIPSEIINENIFEAPTQMIHGFTTIKSNMVESGSDTDEEGIFQSIETDIHEADTQKYNQKANTEHLNENSALRKSANLLKVQTADILKKSSESDSETDEEGVFESRSFSKQTDINDHEALTQKLDPQQLKMSTQNSGKIIVDENSSSDEDINLLRTQSAVMFFGKTETNSDGILNALVQNNNFQTKLEMNIISESDSETDEEGHFESYNSIKQQKKDIHEEPTQKLDKIKSELITHEVSSSNESINLLETQSVVEFLGNIPENVNNNISKGQSQKLIGNNVPINCDVENNIYDEDTQISHKKETFFSAKADQFHNLKVDVIDESSCSDESINLLETQNAVELLNKVKTENVEENIFEAPTQKIHGNDQSVNFDHKNNIFESDTQISIKEDKLNISTGTNEKNILCSSLINIHESDSETDAEDLFLDQNPQQRDIDVHDAVTQKIERADFIKQQSTNVNNQILETSNEKISIKKINFSTINKQSSDSETDEDGFFESESYKKKISGTVNVSESENDKVKSIGKGDKNKCSKSFTTADNVSSSKHVNLKYQNNSFEIKLKKVNNDLNVNKGNTEVKECNEIYKPCLSENDFHHKTIAFVDCNEPRGDMTKFVDLSSSKNEDPVEDDLLPTQQIDHDESNVVIVDDDFDLPPTQKMNNDQDISSEVGCSKNDSALENKLRYLVGDSQADEVEKSLLMTQQLVDVLQDTPESVQIEKDDKQKISPIINKRIRPRMSLSLKKKTPLKVQMTENVEDNLCDIFGQPESTDLDNVSSQMMTQQIVNVLEDKQKSPPINKKHLKRNLSSERSLNLQMVAKQKVSPIKRKSVEVLNETPKQSRTVKSKMEEVSKSLKETGVKRKLSETIEVLPKRSRGRKPKEDANSSNEINVPQKESVNLRPQRKRKLPKSLEDFVASGAIKVRTNILNPRNITTEDKKMAIKNMQNSVASTSNDRTSDVDSQDYYTNLKSHRKTNVLKDSQDSVKLKSKDEAINADSENYSRNIRSKRKTCIIKDYQDSSKDESNIETNSNRPQRNIKSQKKLNVMGELRNKSMKTTELKANINEDSVRDMASTSKVRSNRISTRSKVKHDNIPKITTYIAITSKNETNTKYSPKKYEQVKSSRTAKLSLTKNHNVWESVSTSPKTIGAQSKSRSNVVETRSKSNRSGNIFKSTVNETDLQNVNTRSRGKNTANKKQNVMIDNNSESLNVGEESQEIQAILNSSTNTSTEMKKLNVTTYSPRKAKIKILFTGIQSVKWKNHLSALGITEANTVNTCTYLLTDKIRRTVKFLCALALGKPILSMNWLIDSIKAGQCLNDWESYILQDTKTEEDYEFSLEQSLRKAKENKLFKGYSILLTPKIDIPPISDLKEMIKCSGGQVLTNVPRRWQENTVIISSKNDLENAKKFVIKAPKFVTVHSTEFILGNILRQEINFNMYKLKL